MPTLAGSGSLVPPNNLMVNSRTNHQILEGNGNYRKQKYTRKMNPRNDVETRIVNVPAYRAINAKEGQSRSVESSNLCYLQVVGCYPLASRSCQNRPNAKACISYLILVAIA